MTAFLERELTTVALCWRLERRDGVAMGFTTHDRDLAIGGLLYRAAPGMLPSAITLSDGFSADSIDIEGALRTDHGLIVVHGHTIVDQPEQHANRIALDTGAYRSGVLTAIGLEGDERWFLTAQAQPSAAAAA